MVTNRIKGKRAVITGATKGIGMALSLALLEAGVRVILVGRNFSILKTRLKKMSPPDGSYQLIKADLTRDEEIEEIVNEAISGPVDLLVHGAGVISLGNVEQLPVGDMDWQYKVNVRAPYLLSQKLIPSLRMSKGQVIFVNSTAGLNSWAKISQYSASKHALKAITNSMRAELMKEHIRLMNIFLGSVDTPMQREIHEQLGNVEYTPGKFMKPEDVAELIINLLNAPEGISVNDITIKPNT
jgi:NADP-dependent 3-hydroxy acid dehydrogenase YdfG